jgi:hypothetical protein
VSDLGRARELYARGLDAALRLRARDGLTALEANVVAAFESDVERCDAALAELGLVPGP